MIVNKQEWTNLWQKCNGTLFQSLEWAKIKEKEGCNPLFITIKKDSNLSAGILAFEQDLQTPLGKKKILFSDGIPLYLSQQDAIDILKKFKQEAKNYFYGLISPAVVNSELEPLFKEISYYRTNNHTFIINLEKEEEEIFSLFKRDIKKRIKKNINLGIIVEKNNLSDISHFFQIYKKTMIEGGVHYESKSFFDEVSILIKKNLLNLWTAKLKNKLISGIIVLNLNDSALYFMSGSSDKGYNLQSNTALLWSAIKDCKSNGVKHFDLGGYDLNAKPGEKIYTINKFKERFGGDLAELPKYSTNWKYYLVRLLMRKFRFLKKIYAKSK